jgi:hypothetical protein
LITSSSAGDLRRQKRPLRMQQFLKALARAARARVVSAELFGQLFVAMDDACAALDVCFGGETAAALTGSLESKVGRNRWVAWDTSALGSFLSSWRIVGNGERDSA